MASFDYRLNPLYAIKECSSCGTLYTGDCGCSKGGLEDKILVPRWAQSNYGGFKEFEDQRKKKFDKQIDSNVMISSKGIDGGVDL
ncbi:hypothetical protein Tco_0940798 [Tanacetum coccineum]|uniref:Uncharacterized protein n=1 Tax=Tanacetum coccineum TaxID=301880 RepID=A0ABQ5DRL1_9ASTR